MTSVEKLDSVLSMLNSNHKDHFHKSISEATTVVSDLAEAEILLEKLVKDGYADKRAFTKTDDPIGWIVDRVYSITFEGKLFLESGGYSQQLKDNKRKSNQRAAYIIAVGVGTALAGVYALLELIRFLAKQFCP